MLVARLLGRPALRSPRLISPLGAAVPAISVSRAREQSDLLKLASAGVLLGTILASEEPASCSRRGPQPESKKKVQPAPQAPKGKGPVKRTPTSAFDPAAKDDNIYQCEKIVAQRLAKG